MEELKSLDPGRQENTAARKHAKVSQPSTDEHGDVKMGDDEGEDDDGDRARRRGGDRANERKRQRVLEQILVV
jgi:hypothetical protein